MRTSRDQHPRASDVRLLVVYGDRVVCECECEQCQCQCQCQGHVHSFIHKPDPFTESLSSFRIERPSASESIQMRFSAILPLALVALSCNTLALAQTDDTSNQLDPSATCPYQTGDQIQTCLAQVESDEATRPGGPCTDGDWSCICNVSLK